MNHRHVISLLTLVVLSCGRSTTQMPDEAVPPETYGGTEQPAQSSQPYAGAPAQCVGLNQRCGSEAGVTTACCGSARCIEYSVYDWRRCSTGKADGAYCYASDQCQSLRCVGSKCVASTCKAVGTVCQTDSSCCTGTFCNGSLAYGYGPSRCSAPQVNGASCTSNVHCQSGICRDYECVASVCSAAGLTCGTDADCCGGLFCDESFSYGYGPRRCRAPQANGWGCSANSHCQSGVCRDYQCVSASCSKPGVSCSANADCCNGTYCDNQHYGPWQCAAAQKAGSYCRSPQECISQICTRNLCQ